MEAVINENYYIVDNGQVFFDYGPVSMVVLSERNGKVDTDLAISAFPTIDECLISIRDRLDILKQFPSNVDVNKLSHVGLKMANTVLDIGDELLTPMATVAGSIAQETANYLFSKGATKVVCNNGGDIAIKLSSKERVKLGIISDLSKNKVDMVTTINSEDLVEGICTSGLGGRSFTQGIASAVTVFSSDCSYADALATHICNKSYFETPKIKRVKAKTIDLSSDIAELDVVVSVDDLTINEKEMALNNMMAEASIYYNKNMLKAVVATVQGITKTFDPLKILKL